ncbi:2-oxoglutarate receptor 1-like [Eublepharis macularius]|uniref:2-oxoglutarate receptor 1-like n=1 Tax=Eublepharis macularius TaxID=481883 RepID=A0AA97KST9_EUBMA|nr:2-oxoglutarate receptor 1-like [Eublepharis macularius]
MITTDIAASDDVANITGALLDYDLAALKNCTDDVDELRTSYLPPLYSMIFVVAFPGNIIALAVYAFKMRPWKSSTIIMFNLACTDLLYLSGLPFLIHYYANGEHWIFGEFMCRFIRFGFHFNLYSSILFLTCFSIFRYLAVVHPIRTFYFRKKSWTVVACIVAWAISLTVVTPVNFLITSADQENKSICLDLTSSENLDVIRWYNWLLTGFIFYVPLITVTLCYALVIYTLATGPHTQNPYKQKARKLAFLLLVVFYVCFLPFHVFRIVRIELRLRPVSCEVENQIHAAYIICRPLAALNTCANLLLYVIISGNFQQAVQSLLRCRLSNYIQQSGSHSELNKSGIILKL